MLIVFSQGLAVFRCENSQGAQSVETSEGDQQSQGTQGKISSTSKGLLGFFVY